MLNKAHTNALIANMTKFSGGIQLSRLLCWTLADVIVQERHVVPRRCRCEKGRASEVAGPGSRVHSGLESFVSDATDICEDIYVAV